MFKKTLTLFTLAFCGMMSLQAMDIASHSQAIEIHQEQLACCSKGGCKRKHTTFAIEGTLMTCSKCKGKHLA